MTENLDIRDSLPGDTAGIEALYPQAFPDEDLLPLLRDLLQETDSVLSLVATLGSSLAGHVMFTHCGIPGGTGAVALLGPLAVAPARQRQGIGSALVRAGFQQMENSGVTRVCVLGDPAYYGRFGFTPEAEITPPYPLPAEWRGAWQSIRLRDTGTLCQGTLAVPRPWRRQDLWTS